MNYLSFPNQYYYLSALSYMSFSNFHAKHPQLSKRKKKGKIPYLSVSSFTVPCSQG